MFVNAAKKNSHRMVLHYCHITIMSPKCDISISLSVQLGLLKLGSFFNLTPNPSKF